MFDKFCLRMIVIVGLLIVSAGNSQAEDVSFYAEQEVEKGWEAFKIGKADEALRNFTQATIIDPDYAPAYYGKGHAYIALNKIGLAISNLKKSIELANPPIVETYIDLGFALTISGREQEGLKMYNHALDLDPTNGNAHLNLANFYCSELNGAKAWEHIRFAQKMKVNISAEQLDEMKSLCPEN